MRIKLDEDQRRELQKKPESGMGYQRADVRLPDGRTAKNALVFNGEIAEVPDRGTKE